MPAGSQVEAVDTDPDPSGVSTQHGPSIQPDLVSRLWGLFLIWQLYLLVWVISKLQRLAYNITCMRLFLINMRHRRRYLLP